MRLQKYILNESYTNLNEVVEMLKRDCKPYLSEIRRTDKLLYRGYGKPIGYGKPPKGSFNDSEVVYYLKKKPRKDRRPLSTGLLTHDALDDLFKKKFGWKVRSEGVFVTSDYITASGYGKTYFFFPIGQFRYVWSPIVGDLWIYLRTHVSSRKGKSKQADLPGIVDSYIDHSLWEAIKIENEVSIKCKEYYIVDIGLDSKTFTKAFKDMLL